MMIKLNKLEKKLLNDAQPDLAWGALVASGAKAQGEINSYLTKIDMLCQQLEAEITGEEEIRKAKTLFDWLWKTKPNRYESQGNFRLTEVIDAQLDPKLEKVGNCLGLTLLYNVLAQRFGLKVRAVHLEEAFARGPHVFSILYTKQGTIDIENIFPNGFDFKGHLANPQRTAWDDAALIADIYNSVGNEQFERDELQAAVQSYSKALRLNPKYTKAFLNRGLALSLLEQDEEAKADFERAGQ